jgi:hypothetical protein
MKFVSALALFLAVGWAAATVDVCSESGLDNSTSGYCTCKSATINKQPVAQISCSIDKTSSIFDGTVTAVLYPCTDPAKFVVDVSALGTDYGNYTVTMGQEERIEIPGLTFTETIGTLTVTVQGYLVMSMDGNTKDFTTKIDLDFCTTIWGVQLCGDQINPSLPYNLITGEMTTTGICAS